MAVIELNSTLAAEVATFGVGNSVDKVAARSD